MSSSKTQNNELLYASVGYLRGKGLVYGSAPILPPQAANKKDEFVSKDVSVFGDQVFNWIVINEPDGIFNRSEIRALVRKLKPGGHILTSGEENTKSLLAESGGFKEKHPGVYKYLPNQGKGITHASNNNRRACIVRYGALGDAVLLTPLIRQLHSDGLEVTLNITPYCEPVLRHNPYAKNLILQERDAIPNSELGQYWEFWRKQYDRYINLSESIEGTLLKVEGRRDFYTTQSFRERTCSVNYQDRTMEIGGYPESLGLRGELYFTSTENREAKRIRDKYKDKFLVLWGLTGSSHHKVYAPAQIVVEDFLGKHPDAYIILTGDDRAKPLQFDHPRVVKTAGEWDLRLVMCLTGFVDCVVGPESALVNFASCYPTPKITLLSHSSRENLTKHWEGDHSLAPEKALASCYPCHQLHYTRESCPIVEIVDEGGVSVGEGPVCSMGAIREETLLNKLEEIYSLRK